MTPAEKALLIKESSLEANFHKEYSEVNRKWFAKRMIEFYISTGVSDANVKTTLITFLQECKTIADTKQDFKIGIVLSAKVLRSTLSRRVEIIYGALASKPDLVKAANANFLDFIIRRRFRVVMRMDYYVNPNKQGYFRYPDKCPTIVGNDFQLNNTATPFWLEYNAGYFRLPPPPPTGPVAGPVFSLEKIFISKEKPCEGNLLDCARVLSIIFMDSLFESHDKATLLNYIAGKPDDTKAIPNSSPPASVTVSYLGVCHPHDEPLVHFITDAGSEGLFSKSNVPSTDLQVGDHAYIYNHPLYKVFNPNGSWRGEHALVYDLRNRDFKSKKGFLFGGHGKEGTLYAFYSAFLQELKTHIERTYAIAKIYLTLRQTGALSNGTHAVPGGNVKISADSKFKYFEFNASISYLDYERKGAGKTENKFVVAEKIGVAFSFLIDKNKTLAALLSAGHITEPIILTRKTPPGSGSTASDDYNPEFYSIVYQKPDSTTVELYDLFKRTGTRIQLRQIGMDDLFADPFMTVPGTGNLVTTQPRVDISSTYLSFLRLRKAIS